MRFGDIIVKGASGKVSMRPLRYALGCVFYFGNIQGCGEIDVVAYGSVKTSIKPLVVVGPPLADGFVCPRS
ncbi:hypothetical protein D3C72_2412410 [compost metagenome]